MRILLADDEPFVLDLLEMSLMSAGHTVKAVADGLQALECLKTGSYDLVITDLTMPNVDGLALAKRIKVGNADQKVVLLTGYGVESQLPPNVDAVLSKPVRMEEVHQLLKRFTV